MSLTKFDFSKFFDLQVLVIEPDPAASHLMKQILQGLGMKKLDMARSAEELLSLEHAAPYDIIFLDYDADPGQTGQDLVERIIDKQLLKASSRLVLLATPNDRLRYALDYPFHQISLLDRPYNKFHIDDELKQHVKLAPFLEPVLTLVQKRRYVDAFKLITELQQKAGADTPAQLLPLKVAVLLELGVFDAASGLIKNACARQQGWALWAQFRIDYENGDLEPCQEFLQNPADELQKYQEKREYWSVFLALNQNDFTGAAQIVSQIPAAGMSLRMAQLVQLVLVLAGQEDQAIEFIERKRRLIGSGYGFCALSLSLCRVLLYLHQFKQRHTDALLQLLNQTFKQVVADKEVQSFAAEVVWLQASLVQLNSGNAAAEEFIERQRSHLESMQMSLPALCHAAVLLHRLDKHQAAFELMLRANRLLSQLPYTTARVYVEALYRQSFQLIYPPEQRAGACSRMGQRYQQDTELKLAAKMYYSAYQLAPTEMDYQLQLAHLLSQLKLTKFKSFQLP
ncbi:hypothetical protein ACFO3I_08365 [Rheinheimera marina]|uniref:Response regulatory domain-containing protein n=1 Tax=Rheinheimera marina TaxID=1774958 RepID=A0ABV9JLC8_9GAMM